MDRGPLDNDHLLGQPVLPEGEGHPLLAEGATVVPAHPEALWAILMDEQRLGAVIPKARNVRRTDESSYAADVPIGVGPLKTTYLVEASFRELRPPRSLRLTGGATGRFGASRGEAYVALSAAEAGTRVAWRYAVLVGGPVGRFGPLVERVADRLIARFFQKLIEHEGEHDSAGDMPEHPSD